MKTELLGTKKACPRATLPTTNLTLADLGMDEVWYILRYHLTIHQPDYLVEIK